ILSWRVRDPNLPVISLSLVLLGLIAVLLMLQPDFGATVLFFGVWFVIALLSGLSIVRVAWLGVAGVLMVAAAYMFYPNAQ
ncbi:hypothetical protein ABTM33_19595, partial [Acinetobacter baumannii]